MPEIQIIPRSPDSFNEGLQNSLSAGQGIMGMVLAGQQLKDAQIRNQLLTTQLKQQEELLPLQKALMQSNVEHTAASTEAIKSGIDLDREKLDFSTMDADRMYNLAAKRADLESRQVEEQISDSRSQRNWREKNYPLLVAKAYQDLSYTQAQIQALQNDSTLKQKAFTLQEQQQSQQMTQADIMTRAHILSEYEQAAPARRQQMKNDPKLAPIVGDAPIESDDVNRYINEKIGQAARLSPDLAGQLAAVRISQYMKENKVDQMQEMMQQMQNGFKGETQFGQLRKGLTEIFKKQAAGKTAATQPVGGGVASTDPLAGLDDAGTSTSSQSSYVPPEGQSAISRRTPVKTGIDTEKLYSFFKVDDSGLNTSLSEDYVTAADQLTNATGRTAKQAGRVTLNKKPFLAEAFRQIQTSKDPDTALGQFEASYSKYLDDKDMKYLADQLVAKGVFQAPAK